jgi:diguanylate cyclase (GGDEF)-like protein
MLSLTRTSSQRRRSGGDDQNSTPTLATAVPIDAVPVSGTTIDVLTDDLRDDLTDLGSLLFLREHLQRLVDQYQPFGARPALMLIDIDGFGRINASYGRAVADQVLVITASRLRRLVPDANATYRTGGDEFVALLHWTPMIDAVAMATEIQSVLSQPVDVGQSFIPISVSVAVVMLGHRHRVDGLLRDADVTMYRAKTEGGNRVDVYNWEIDSWSTARRRETERLQSEVEKLRMQNRMLAEAMTVDVATGMPNALAFEADHLQLSAWRKRSGEPYSVLRICVKGIDDAGNAFRSQEGGKSLAAVAHAIRDKVRQADRAYVLGEGEFAVLLRGSATKQALIAAERIRSAVDNLAAPHPANPAENVGIIIAAIEAGFRHSDINDVVQEVDEVLRRAVVSGGATIVWPH